MTLYVHRPARRRLRLLAGVVVALLVFASAAATFASTSSTTWPHAVRVYNPTGWQIAVGSAVDAWNRSGSGARFVLVDDEREADVVVVASDEELAEVCPEGHDCIGYSSQIGYRAARGGRCGSTCPPPPTASRAGPRSRPRRPRTSSATCSASSTARGVRS